MARRAVIHGRFRRSEDFCLQNCAILCNAARTPNDRITSISDAAQPSENARRNSFLNYRSSDVRFPRHRALPNILFEQMMLLGSTLLISEIREQRIEKLAADKMLESSASEG